MHTIVTYYTVLYIHYIVHISLTITSQWHNILSIHLPKTTDEKDDNDGDAQDRDDNKDNDDDENDGNDADGTEKGCKV